DLRAFTRRFLERTFRVVDATDGRAALAVMRDVMPDVVVTDVMMPWMDGYDLLTAIRKDDELADVPVILLTARGELDARIEGLTRGADAYLAKPFEPLELAVQIDALLAQRLRLRERLLARIASAQLV